MLNFLVVVPQFITPQFAVPQFVALQIVAFDWIQPEKPEKNFEKISENRDEKKRLAKRRSERVWCDRQTN